MADLQEEIAFLVGHNTKGRLRATMRTAVKVHWRKRRLERMEKDLANAERVMQSALLAQILYVFLQPLLNRSQWTATKASSGTPEYQHEIYILNLIKIVSCVTSGITVMIALGRV